MKYPLPRQARSTRVYDGVEYRNSQYRRLIAMACIVQQAPASKYVWRRPAELNPSPDRFLPASRPQALALPHIFASTPFLHHLARIEQEEATAANLDGLVVCVWTHPWSCSRSAGRVPSCTPATSVCPALQCAHRWSKYCAATKPVQLPPDPFDTASRVSHEATSSS
ncbi:hypothetical protein K461DRAFT_300438, partial [Myriangium duriaei CBS 260.36]